MCCVIGGQRPQGAEGANEVQKLSARETLLLEESDFLFYLDIQLIGWDHLHFGEQSAYLQFIDLSAGLIPKQFPTFLSMFLFVMLFIGSFPPAKTHFQGLDSWLLLSSYVF